MLASKQHLRSLILSLAARLHAGIQMTEVVYIWQNQVSGGGRDVRRFDHCVDIYNQYSADIRGKATSVCQVSRTLNLSCGHMCLWLTTAIASGRRRFFPYGSC